MLPFNSDQTNNRFSHELLQQKLANTECVIFDVDGVLTDGKLYFDDHGNEFKSFDAQDGLAMKLLMKYLDIVIITGRHSPCARARLVDNLGIEHYYQGCINKLTKLHEVLENTPWQLENIVYVGDDLIDLQIMAAVGTSAAPTNADPFVQQQANWLLTRAGGSGAAKEVCDAVLDAKNLRQPLLQEFLHGRPESN